MTWASNDRRPAGAPARIQSNTGRSSAYTPNFRLSGVRGHGYLVAASRAARVRLRPDRALVTEALRIAERLGLEPGQDPQRLGVALEAADVRAQGVEGVLAVVAERWVAEVVGEAGGLHEVGVAAQGGSQLPPDLGDLQGVGHPGPGEVALAGDHHLGLGGQPSPGSAVQDAGPVARERRSGGALGWLVGPAVLIGDGVSGHRHDPTVGVRRGASPTRGCPRGRGLGGGLGSTPVGGTASGRTRP